RQERPVEFCHQMSQWVGANEKHWFGTAWNAMQIMTFIADPTPDRPTQTEWDFFFRFVARIFPNAETAKWNAILNEQNEAFRGKINNPAPVSETVPWCATRERLMISVHRLRVEAQLKPKFD